MTEATQHACTCACQLSVCLFWENVYSDLLPIFFDIFKNIELYESEKVKVLVTQSCPTLCDPIDGSLPDPWSEQPFPSPGDLPDPRIKPGSPALQTDSLPSKPPKQLEKVHQDHVIYQVIFNFVKLVEYICLHQFPYEFDLRALGKLDMYVMIS